jgi:uncharacterized protein (TIGR03905 family)
MKKLLIIALMAIFSVSVQAQENAAAQQAKQEVVVDDYRIISDETVDGVRYVSAAPSATVCSKQIDIQIKDGIILSVKYTRGCDGNAKGIGALIKDMSVEEAIRRLEGITCGRRPTSCPDQLAKILKLIK